MLHVHGTGSCSLSKYCKEGINRYSTTDNALLSRIGVDGCVSISRIFRHAEQEEEACATWHSSCLLHYASIRVSSACRRCVPEPV